MQIKNDIITPARSAMIDSNAAGQLEMTTPARTFKEMERARAYDYGGKALYRRIIDDAVAEVKALRTVADPIGCFVAGTLVHTKEGLVPIEQIKVGDWVLSQPEDQGEVSYRRVVNTFRFEEKEVFQIQYCLKEVSEKAQEDGRTLTDDEIETQVATGNHPFWVKDAGWTRLDHICPGDEIELADGQYAEVFDVLPIFITDTDGVGWTRMYRSEYGWLIDLRNGHIKPQPSSEETVENEFYDWGDEDSCRMSCTVYNFEVDDHHTYYVGRLGAWVHNTQRA